MSDTTDWNAHTIKEFRAKGGQVGGSFEGARLVLVHHTGRKTGTARVTPVMYRTVPGDDDVIYIFASAAGAPNNPDWYYNLRAAGHATIELGTETYDVDVREVEGGRREEIYAAQAHEVPGFAEYEQKTRGIRTIPVLALQRASG